MSEIAKYMTIDIGNISKIIGVAKSNVARVMTANTPTAPAGGDRGVFGGGRTSDGRTNTIQYITISTTGNATDFGDLLQERESISAASNGSNERGVWMAGSEAGVGINTIEYITISTTGIAADFADGTVNRYRTGGLSNKENDRGLCAGGDAIINVIDYITISVIGANATDFGDLIASRLDPSGTSNSTNNRGVWGGGYTTTNVNIIDYVTISTTGNATDFGDLGYSAYSVSACSNGTSNRGIFWSNIFNTVNSIEYITISSIGNASLFGSLIVGAPAHSAGASSNGTNDRGVCAGGYDGSAILNNIQYITISTTGNATDFGDLSGTGTRYIAATENA